MSVDPEGKSSMTCGFRGLTWMLNFAPDVAPPGCKRYVWSMYLQLRRCTMFVVLSFHLGCCAFCVLFQMDMFGLRSPIYDD